MRIPVGTMAILAAVWCLGSPRAPGADFRLEVAGVKGIPHVRAESLRYRRAPEPELGAWVQVFLRSTGSEPGQVGPATRIRVEGRTPDECLQSREWTWYDLPEAWSNRVSRVAPGDLVVWQFNGRTDRWRQGSVGVEWTGESGGQRFEWDLRPGPVGLRAVTFLGDGSDFHPDRVVVHVANASDRTVRLTGLRLWPAVEDSAGAVYRARPAWTNLTGFGGQLEVTAGGRGGFTLATGRLPVGPAVVEVLVTEEGGREFSLWSQQRVWRWAFDISGGWVNSGAGGRSTLTYEPYLKLLRRFQVNTAHIEDGIAGYTDSEALYGAYPLKYFHRLQPFARYDTDALLPRIHAVEFLGEPQYGGGRPVPPMEVWRALQPYQATRLPTTVTHSEERVWRDYAGLCDYPHYDAYRVTAPSPDAWDRYDRWEGERIRWGAPLETIGDMCRSLRECHLPLPTAYWSQGPHAGWGRYGGRARTSPTPDELRLQAYHALASRVTSLYWFNLSLKSLLKFPDTWDALTRVGREIRLLEDLLLEGDAFEHRRLDREGRPDWELASVTAPGGAVLFGLDLDYRADRQERVFRFGEPRDAEFDFGLPAHLRNPADVLAVDADGCRKVDWRLDGDRVRIRDRASRVVAYLVAPEAGLRQRVEARRAALVREEERLNFDPLRRVEDLEALRAIPASD